MKNDVKVICSPARLAKRLTTLGRSISRDYAGRTVEIREVKLDGHDCREICFSQQPRLKGRDVLLVGAVLDSGVTQDFLVRRLQDSRPRSLRLAFLVDKPQARRVDLKPDYFGFVGASNYLVGYGLSGRQGGYRNLPYLGALRAGRRRTGKRARQVR